jgi:hypothetical protein
MAGSSCSTWKNESGKQTAHERRTEFSNFPVRLPDSPHQSRPRCGQRIAGRALNWRESITDCPGSER